MIKINRASDGIRIHECQLGKLETNTYKQHHVSDFDPFKEFLKLEFDRFNTFSLIKIKEGR